MTITFGLAAFLTVVGVGAAATVTGTVSTAVSTVGASVDAVESLVTVACDTAVSGSLVAGTLLPDVSLPLALAHAANNEAEIAKHTRAVRRFPIRPTLLRVAVIALDECPPTHDPIDADMQRAGAPDGDTGSLLFTGGAEGNRTPDLFIANEALCQLSYSPVECVEILAVASANQKARIG